MLGAPGLNPPRAMAGTPPLLGTLPLTGETPPRIGAAPRAPIVLCKTALARPLAAIILEGLMMPPPRDTPIPGLTTPLEGIMPPRATPLESINYSLSF